MEADNLKLITLARGARGRIGAQTGAAVRDDTGRSYVGADITLPSLHVSALQLAVAQAVAAGARGLEAASVVSTAPKLSEADRTLLREAGGGTGTAVVLADPSGTVVGDERL